MRWRLELQTLEVKARIGVTALERAVPQAMEISFSVEFASRPLGCESDSIDDTHCYGMLCDTLRELCESQEFQLIEALALQLSQALKSKLPKDSVLELKVKKVHPPVAGLRGGASFQITA